MPISIEAEVSFTSVRVIRGQIHPVFGVTISVFAV